MASEPITLFAPTADPARVLAEVVRRYPTATHDGPRWTWLRVDLADGALTLQHDPAHYSGAGWADQRRGMAAYLRRFPGDAALHARVAALVDRLGFALGLQFEPDYDEPSGDERFAIICGLTAMLGGVLFTPAALRDFEGRILVSASGEHDPDAAWP